MKKNVIKKILKKNVTVSNAQSLNGQIFGQLFTVEILVEARPLLALRTGQGEAEIVIGSARASQPLLGQLDEHVQCGHADLGHLVEPHRSNIGRCLEKEIQSCCGHIRWA